MKRRRLEITLAALALLASVPWIVGCPGDGSGLRRCGDGIIDSLEECDDGNNVDEDGCSSTCLDESGLRPTLASIQTQIFTPSCGPGCHEIGGIAPMALDTEEASFMNLVGSVSVELPPLLRVRPGEPEESYLVWKVDGRDEIVGGQMPLFGTPLTQEEVDAIVGWIANGAKP